METKKRNTGSSWKKGGETGVKEDHLISRYIMKYKKIIHFLILALSIILLSSACSTEKYLSRWDDNTITVDGNQTDWDGNLKYIEDERTAVGVFNNDENLYICFTTDDNLKIIQIMKMGLTLWLVPGDGNAKTRGIKYPLRSDEFEIQQMREKRLIGYEKDYIKNLLEINKKKQTELQIVNDQDYSLYMYSLNEAPGIKIKLGESMGQLVYEISVPIGGESKNDFSMALLPGDDIMVRFETGEYSRPERSHGSGMQPGGDFTGRGRSGKANRTGVPGVEIYSRPEPVDIQFVVTLAGPV
jgi:hypothetical protein